MVRVPAASRAPDAAERRSGLTGCLGVQAFGEVNSEALAAVIKAESEQRASLDLVGRDEEDEDSSEATKHAEER